MLLGLRKCAKGSDARTTTAFPPVTKNWEKKSVLLCVDAQKYIRKRFLTARLFLVAQGDRVKAVDFCQRRDRSSSINQHAFSFMK
jgi:hypothetical protein